MPPVTLPLETRPLETRPLDTQPLDTQPLETQPLETQPLETRSLAAWPLAAWPLAAWPLVLASCAGVPAEVPGKTTDATVRRTVVTMGSELQVAVDATTAGAAERAAEAAIQAVLAADQRWSRWRPDSELSRLHGSPVGEPFPVDEAFRRGFALALFWCERSAGAFDPTIGRLVELPRPAPPSALADALATSGRALFTLEGPAIVRRGEAHIAAGGFAKGLALDAAIAAAAERGARATELCFGGQFAWSGTTPPPPIGVADPRDRGRALLWIEPPARGSLATSGTSEQGAHILDPRTGRAAPDFGTVTVLCTGPDAACAADCLSTALFVLGPKAGLALATELPMVEAVFLVREDSGVRCLSTPGLQARLRSRT